MEHTVKKSRVNRIAMRFTAIVFMFVGILNLWVLVKGIKQTGRAVFLILAVGCATYGFYLFAQTLKVQAYDITYVFGDQTITLKLHHKEKTYLYKEIEDLSYIIPNENLDYGIVQIYIEKEQYIIPFMGNRDVGQALYGMLEIKRAKNS